MATVRNAMRRRRGRLSRLLRLVAAAVVLLVGAGALAFAIFGPERIWRLAGPPDLGDVVFESLERRTTPNDALACPPGICAARSDVTPPVFAMPARELRAAFREAVASEPALERVAENESALMERYIQRTELMRFPDTIAVRFFDVGEGRSSVALYARSQIGTDDWGVNRARIERWLEGLRRKAQPIGPTSG